MRAATEPATFVAAVDLGGTKTAACLVSREGDCGAVLTKPTPAMQGPTAVLDVIAALVRELDHTGETGAHEVVGIGVGAAGVIDHATGTVVSATQALADWSGTRIADELSRRLDGRPVVVDNDVNAHGAGEAWLGAGRGRHRVCMVAVGTGVGGALIVGGRPVHGAHHVAGEIGHVPVPGAEHLKCSCGRPGHVEAIGSGPGLLAHFHWLGGDPDTRDTRQVLAAARQGNVLALGAVRDAATALGRCLAGVATFVDPDVIVIGGGLAEAGSLWWQPMEDSLRAEVIDALAGLCLVPAELGGRAPLVGAAQAVWATVDVGDSAPVTPADES